MTLTKREKILLYILLCTIILGAGVFYLVLPSLQKHMNAKSAYEQAEMKYVTTKSTKVDYKDIEKEVENTTAEFKKIKDKFYKVMEKEEIDRVITNLATDHYLEPITLLISEVEEEEVISYEEFKRKKEVKEEESPAKTPVDTSKTFMKVYNVTLVVNGEIDRVQALVDEANQLFTMKAASVQYSNQDEDLKQMTITFKVFMI